MWSTLSLSLPKKTLRTDSRYGDLWNVNLILHYTIWTQKVGSSSGHPSSLSASYPTSTILPVITLQQHHKVWMTKITSGLEMQRQVWFGSASFGLSASRFTDSTCLHFKESASSTLIIQMTLSWPWSRLTTERTQMLPILTTRAGDRWETCACCDEWWSC